MNQFFWAFEMVLFATTVVVLAGLFFLPMAKHQHQEILQIVRILFYAWVSHNAISWMISLLSPESLSIKFLWMQGLQLLILSIFIAFFAFATQKYWIWIYYNKRTVVLMLTSVWLAQGFLCIWLLN
jgi:hypothetical protein